MPADRLALYATAYPAVAGYLPAWYRSVCAQTDRDFRLWIAVDDMSADELWAVLGETPDAELVVAPPGSSPTAIRTLAIERILGEHDAIVFTDSDDILLPERVASSRAALQSYDVAACALDIVDAGGHDLGIVFGPSAADDPVRMLPRYNVFGLSNSAYRTDLLRRCLPIRPDAPLTDWVLATRAAALGASIHFDSVPMMKYRQYGTNIARVVPPFTAEEVRRAAEIVLLHYDCMLDGEAEPLPPPLRAALCDSRARALEFHRALALSPARSDRYVNALNALPPRYVWWWSVANPELEEVWRS